ncbi:hypothetical protein N7448_010168 [Penicillium atrosanguineum]|uniref:Uncharacterized protein n=1 Tax=Penicillium atrosanguineum TaxID=1132637 RepID=A0A9W9PLG3_9EURO|nr:uncharacterized protein N7443_007390 [Penicillium atrosanguineum]KAJ5118461.1 hypothetical protein N7526_010098 [Penicillium atrosanguineum]KAJ5119499.1 hypothetical protein N7448_010168 [Penicillium atrosanguineum]KAJ5296497.1 hypothetical protein N7443_007390 [Penicillium atrosanguineum]KAJ5299264.1 hypothetical protein N7476_010821 [Penicillium atrosanguineum]
MAADQDELYRKCARKLERVLSKQDCDLRILVGHSNMLSSLTPEFTVEDGYEDDELQDPKADINKCNCGAESDVLACSGHIQALLPMLYEVSVTEKELSLEESEDSCQEQQYVIEKSRIAMHPALQFRPRDPGPFYE